MLTVSEDTVIVPPVYDSEIVPNLANDNGEEALKHVLVMPTFVTVSLVVPVAVFNMPDIEPDTPTVYVPTYWLFVRDIVPPTVE
jgi:hypothetical protein